MLCNSKEHTTTVEYRMLHDKIENCDDDITRRAAKVLGFDIKPGVVTIYDA
jgi:hypothetical protein